METIVCAGFFVLGAIYSYFIYKALHSRFNYVFWGDGFSKHVMGIFVGGFILAGITLALWKIVAVIIGIVGVIFAISQKGIGRKVGIIVATVILIGIVVFFGIAVIQPIVDLSFHEM